MSFPFSLAAPIVAGLLEKIKYEIEIF